MNGGLVYAVYDYSGERGDELVFRCGDAITVLRRCVVWCGVVWLHESEDIWTVSTTFKTG